LSSPPDTGCPLPPHVFLLSFPGLQDDVSCELKSGDITKDQVDVIVNAANENLSHEYLDPPSFPVFVLPSFHLLFFLFSNRGGVAKAIADAAGSGFIDACNTYVETNGQLAIGQSMIVQLSEEDRGSLGCKAVINTVGPRYRGGNKNEAALLYSSIYHSLGLVEQCGYSSVTFPIISSGLLPLCLSFVQALPLSLSL
jgi:O-acetyl-ADP-ribose deacetylase (regulator of RNase III)